MEVLISIALFCVGAVLASFVSVIAERAYTGQSWVRGRSKCDSCAVELSLPDLVPVLSWIVTWGACRTCGARVPVRHALMEAGTGALFLASYVHLGIGVSLCIFLAVLLTLLFIVLYDLRHTVVPFPASLLFIALSIAYAVVSVPDLITAGIWFIVSGITGLFFFCLYFFSRGRVMGLGDAPVALGLSLLAGSASLTGFLFSFWIGALVGIAILVGRRGGPTMGIEVPFVPFLAAGYLLAFFTQWNPFLF